MIPAHVKELLVAVYGSRWGEAYLEWGLFNDKKQLSIKGKGRAATVSPPDDMAVFWTAGLLKPGTTRADENVEKLMVFVMDDVGKVKGKSRIDPDELEMMMPPPTSKPESSPGNAQWQWGITDGMAEDVVTALRRSLPWQSHATAMSNLIRVPMGVSGKPGIVHQVTDLGRGPVYTSVEFIQRCGGLRHPIKSTRGSTGDLIEDEGLLKALVALIPNPVEDWDLFVNVGRAIWGASNGAAFEVFDEWAAKCPAYDAEITQARWDSYYDARIGRFWLMRQAMEADKAGVEDWLKAESKVKFDDGMMVPPPDSEEMTVTMHTVDDFRSVVGEVDFVHVGTGAFWKVASVDANVAPVQVGVKSIKATVWMRSHRYVTELSWMPGYPRIIENSSMGVMGLERRLMHSIFNLYTAPPVTAVEGVNANPWLDLVRKLWPDEAEEIFSWFAHRVQRPEEKINHALVLGGEQGIGKDTVLEAVRRAVGVANCKEITPSDLKSTFNDYVKSVMLVVNELRDDGALSPYAFYEKSKTLIAAPPYTLTLNAKFRQPYVVPNVCGVVMTSNHKQTGLVLTAEDRRHLVCWSDAPAIKEGDEEFAKLWAWLESGGFEHVAAWLRAKDISAFNAKAPPRKTAAFWDIVDAAGSAGEKALRSKVEAMGRPKVLRIKDLKPDIFDDEDENGASLSEFLTDQKYRRVVAEALDKAGYRRVLNPSRGDGRWKINGQDENIYGRKDVSIEELRQLAEKMKKANENKGGTA